MGVVLGIISPELREINLDENYVRRRLEELKGFNPELREYLSYSIERARTYFSN